MIRQYMTQLISPIRSRAWHRVALVLGAVAAAHLTPAVAPVVAQEFEERPQLREVGPAESPERGATERRDVGELGERAEANARMQLRARGDEATFGGLEASRVEPGDLERQLENLDRIMGSTIVQRTIALMCENVELKAEMRVAEAEHRSRSQLEKMELERARRECEELKRALQHLEILAEEMRASMEKLKVQHTAQQQRLRELESVKVTTAELHKRAGSLRKEAARQAASPEEKPSSADKFKNRGEEAPFERDAPETSTE